MLNIKRPLKFYVAVSLISVSFYLFIFSIPAHNSKYTTLSPIYHPSLLTFSYETWGDLIQPAAGCSLPCWWGVTPGHTLQSDANSLFIETLEKRTKSDLSSYIEPPNYSLEIDGYEEVYVSPLYNMPGQGDIWAHGNDDSFVEYIVLNFNEQSIAAHTAASYFLPVNLIRKYGLPDFVGLVAYDHKEKGIFSFRLRLTWEALGLSAAYQQLQNEQMRDKTIPHAPSCFTEKTLDVFTVVLTQRNQTETNRYLEFIDFNLLPVEQVTGLSREEFLSIFLHYKGCLPNNLPFIR